MPRSGPTRIYIRRQFAPDPERCLRALQALLRPDDPPEDGDARKQEGIEPPILPTSAMAARPRTPRAKHSTLPQGGAR
jgi:hypothetical protein